MDQYYYEEGYVEAGYYSIIAEARVDLEPYYVEGYLSDEYFETKGGSATLYCDAEIVVGMLLEAQGYWNSVSSMEISINKTASGECSVDVAFTQTVIGTRGKDIDLFAFSDAAIAVSVDRIRDNNIATSVAFDVATDFVVTRSADADVEDVFSAIINGLRSRDTNMETQAAFSFGVIVDLFKEFESNITAQSSISTTVDVIRNVESSLSSESAQSANGDRVRFGISESTSTFSLDVTARQIRDAHLTGTGVAAISCDAVKTVKAESTLSSQASIGFNGGKLKTAAGALPVYASVFVSRKVAESRPRNLPITVNAVSYFDSSRKKYGTHSWHPAQGSYNPNGVNGISITPADSFYTEGWIYIDNTINAQVSINLGPTAIRITKGGSYSLAGIVDANGNYAILNENNNYYTSANTWTHYAIVSDGSRISWYMWGNRFYTTTSIPASYQKFDFMLYAPSAGVWVDEISFYKGTTLGYNPASTSITQPASARTNSEYTQALWHFDGNGLDDYTAVALTQSADAAITSTASLTSIIGGTFNISAAISSQSSVTAVIGTLEDINLVAFSDAAVNAVGVAIRDNDSQLEIESSLSANGSGIFDSNSSQTAESTSSVSADRIRFAESNQTGSFSQVSDPVKTVENTSSLSANFAVTAVIGTLEDINLVAFGNAAIDALVVKIAVGSVSADATFTQESLAVKTTDTQSSISSEFSQSTDNGRIRNNEAAFSALASTVTLANEFQGITAHISSRFFTTQYYIEEDYNETGYYQQFEVQANKIASGVASLETSASLTASIRTDVFVAMVTTSSASVTADAVKTTDVVALETSESTLSVIGSKTTGYQSSIASSFAIFCNAVTASEINLVAFSNASLSATPEANKPFDSSLSTAFTIYAYTQDSLNSRGSADISSEFSQNTDISYIAGAIIATDAVASALTVAVKETVTDVVCEINAILSADVKRTRSAVISATSSSVLTVNAVKITDISADFENSTNIDADVVKVVSASITTESIATNLIAVAKVAGFFVNADVVSTVSAGVTATKVGVLSVTSSTTLSITFDTLRNAQSAVSSTSTLTATAGVIKPFAVTIASAMSFAVVIRDLRLDEIEYRIPGEGWEYTIVGETRNHRINSETRIRNILTETALRTIGSETRIYNIE